MPMKDSSTPAVSGTSGASSSGELLTQEEEVRLSELVQAGNQSMKKLKEMGAVEECMNGDIPEMTKDVEMSKEVRDLWAKVEKGTQAASQLAEANMRLVVFLAKKYHGYGLSDQDLFQEGYLALMQAIKRFDPGKGIRFSTYAAKWISPAITKAIKEQTRMIKMPTAKLQKLAKLNEAHTALEQDLKRPPTAHEISEKMDIPLKEVEDLMRVRSDSLSLEYEFEEGRGSLGDNIEYDQDLLISDSIVDADTQKALSTELYMALEELDDTSRTVLEMRFGLNGTPPMEIQEVAKTIMENTGKQTTVARVRHIESRALQILKLKVPDLEKIQELLK